MYRGLREELIGEASFERGTLISVLGEKDFKKGLRRLNSEAKHVFVYRDIGSDTVDPVNFSGCYFDIGGVYDGKQLVYFEKPQRLWEGASRIGILDIVPFDSIIEEGRNFRDLKIFSFLGEGDSRLSIIDNNAVEAWYHAYEANGARVGSLPTGIRANFLSKVRDVTPGIVMKGYIQEYARKPLSVGSKNSLAGY